MKKLMTLFAIACLVVPFTGCQKDEVDTETYQESLMDDSIVGEEVPMTAPPMTRPTE